MAQYSLYISMYNSVNTSGTEARSLRPISFFNQSDYNTFNMRGFTNGQALDFIADSSGELLTIRVNDEVFTCRETLIDCTQKVYQLMPYLLSPVTWSFARFHVICLTNYSEDYVEKVVKYINSLGMILSQKIIAFSTADGNLGLSFYQVSPQSMYTLSLLFYMYNHQNIMYDIFTQIGAGSPIAKENQMYVMEKFVKDGEWSDTNNVGLFLSQAFFCAVRGKEMPGGYNGPSNASKKLSIVTIKDYLEYFWKPVMGNRAIYYPVDRDYEKAMNILLQSISADSTEEEED